MQKTTLVQNLIEGLKKKGRSLFDQSGKKGGLNWIRRKYLKHAEDGVERKFDFQGHKIYYTHPRELLHALKEIFIEEVYHAPLGEIPFILDCGANIGLSVIYLKRKFPEANIIAFEPDEENFRLLQKNIASFQFDGIDIRKEAVWVEETTISFCNDGSMSSKIEEGGKGKKVRAIRLKDYLNRRVDLLKLDIEGAEYEVLKDISGSLHQVKYLFFEYHGKFHQQNELLHALELIHEAGFSFYIKEAAEVYAQPFTDIRNGAKHDYDIQLNIFCIRT